MPNIKCGVEECQYWDNMICTADSIEVRSSGDRRVRTSEDTACHSFRPRKS
ncbi:MAG: DUF1540 domain-containing protein [Thermanaeromonas sp.]|uniref:DUF1540 domain-containing protein n=1 Tax=Thermanaeromonas sp. TaxID=2003697 RepID=UPI00243D5522|nr:DUF1540 domain-containing protein [Thermanaeromonas sp.]MCG0277039.1 DUF1540 domain-containing protein [Thermanaeromonas sp.]